MNNFDIFSYISDLLGIPILIPIIIFSILILGLLGFIYFVYKKISEIKPTDDETEKNRK